MIWLVQKKYVPLHPQTKNGAIAQLVEQRTENPCVPGSIPGGTTSKKRHQPKGWCLFLFYYMSDSWLYLFREI